MFAVEVFCGSKYGRWLRSLYRFTTHDQAKAYIANIDRAEDRAGATPMLRRAVPIS